MADIRGVVTNTVQSLAFLTPYHLILIMTMYGDYYYYLRVIEEKLRCREIRMDQTKFILP